MRYKWKMGECAGIWKEEFVLDARESVNKTSFGENYGVKTVRGCVEEEFGSGIVGRRDFGWFSAMNER